MPNDRIHLELWPMGSIHEGLPVKTDASKLPCKPVVFDLSIADAELLERLYSRSEHQFKKNAAYHLRKAILQWCRSVSEDEI
jgi:hypothetical protein